MRLRPGTSHQLPATPPLQRAFQASRQLEQSGSQKRPRGHRNPPKNGCFIMKELGSRPQKLLILHDWWWKIDDFAMNNGDVVFQLHQKMVLWCPKWDVDFKIKDLARKEVRIWSSNIELWTTTKGVVTNKGGKSTHKTAKSIDGWIIGRQAPNLLGIDHWWRTESTCSADRVNWSKHSSARPNSKWVPQMSCWWWHLLLSQRSQHGPQNNFKTHWSESFAWSKFPWWVSSSPINHAI